MGGRVKTVVVELALGVDGKTLPLSFIPEEATAEDRRLVDRWRAVTHDLKGYTAIARWPDAADPGAAGPSSALTPAVGGAPSSQAPSS